MKGKLTLRALEIMEHAACGVGDVMFIFSMPYGTSLGRALHRLEKRQEHRGSWARDVAMKYEERQRFYALFYRLKRDGIIREAGKKKFRITENGMHVLATLRKRKNHALPEVKYAYHPAQEFTLIIFDIPEIERRKRQWMRAVLKRLKFTMLQKSVWVGKTRIPKEFLEDLQSLALLQCVHIFVISKTGSLETFR